MFKLNKFICFIAILLSFSSCKAPNESFNDESNKESQSESLSEEKKYLLTFDDNGHEIFQGHSLTLFTNLFCNNEEIYNYTVTYTSLDDTIVSVSQDGVVTGIKEGSTKIKAVVNEYECNPAFYEISVIPTYSSADVVNEKIINYYGRVLFQDNCALLLNTASAFELTFYGNSLSANFNRGFGLKIRVFVDGKDKGTQLIKSTTLLCEGLESGLHTVKVVRCNYEYRGVISLSSISGASYYLPAPNKPDLKFEFYGDSITVGCGVNADGSGDTIANEDGTLTYAYKTIEHYNAQANYIAFDGGSVIFPTWRGWSIPDQYDKYSCYLNTTKWDFNKYIPDYVVINLGTNDVGMISRGEGTVKEFESLYLDFLFNLRRQYKDTTIICFYGMMGVDRGVSLAINNAVIKSNDSNIHYLEYGPVSCSGHEYHPDINGQIQASNKLIDFIDTIKNYDKSTDNYSVKEVNNVSYKDGYKIYELNIEKDTNFINAFINLGTADYLLNGAISVSNCSTIINVKANNLNSYFNAYSSNVWKEFSDQSDEVGNVSIRIFANKDRVIPAGTKVYVSYKEVSIPKEGVDYSISKTDEQSYLDYEVYKIEILKENEGFTAEINTGLINKQVSAAIMVYDTVRWIHIETTGYNKWFRNEWNQTAWWEATKQWDTFTYKTDSTGVLTLNIGIYTVNDAGAYGPIVKGVKIFVAIK